MGMRLYYSDRYFESTLRYLNDISKIGEHVLFSKDLHRHIVPFGTSFSLGVNIGVNPPQQIANFFAMGRCLLDVYQEM